MIEVCYTLSIKLEFNYYSLAISSFLQFINNNIDACMKIPFHEPITVANFDLTLFSCKILTYTMHCWSFDIIRVALAFFVSWTSYNCWLQFDTFFLQNLTYTMHCWSFDNIKGAISFFGPTFFPSSSIRGTNTCNALLIFSFKYDNCGHINNLPWFVNYFLG